MEEEGIAEVFLDDTAIADVASECKTHTHTHTLPSLPLLSPPCQHTGPGTSLKGPPGTASRGISQGIRYIYTDAGEYTLHTESSHSFIVYGLFIFYTIYIGQCRNRDGHYLDLFVPGHRVVVLVQWSRQSGRPELQ